MAVKEETSVPPNKVRGEYHEYNCEPQNLGVSFRHTKFGPFSGPQGALDSGFSLQTGVGQDQCGNKDQYKSVIDQYLEKNGMPFKRNFKRGF